MSEIFESEWRKLGFRSKKDYENSLIGAINAKTVQDTHALRGYGKKQIENLEKAANATLESLQKYNEKILEKHQTAAKKTITAYNKHIDKKLAELKIQSKHREKQEKQESKKLKLQMKLDDMNSNIQVHQKMIELLLPYSSTSERRQTSIKEKQNQLAKMIEERDLFIKENNL